MKKLIRIALIQSEVSPDITANLKTTEKMIRTAAKAGANIICLQELFQTPYFPQRQGVKKALYAEPVPGNTSVFMQKLAKELGVVLIVPIYQKGENGKYYNTAVVFDDKGKLLGQYHKVHIPHDPGFYEKEYFEASDQGYKIFKTKYGRFAVMICYDQWFPEAARAARLAGAEIIFYPTAIGYIKNYNPEGDWHDAWETIQRSHGIANSVYIAAVNRVGEEDNMEFFGQSFISDPFGKVLTRGSKNKNAIVMAEIDLALNKFFEEGWGFLRNRRPETYQTLTSNLLVKKSKKLQKVAHYEAMQKALEK